MAIKNGGPREPNVIRLCNALYRIVFVNRSYGVVYTNKLWPRLHSCNINFMNVCELDLKFKIYIRYKKRDHAIPLYYLDQQISWLLLAHSLHHEDTHTHL